MEHGDEMRWLVQPCCIHVDSAWLTSGEPGDQMQQSVENELGELRIEVHERCGECLDAFFRVLLADDKSRATSRYSARACQCLLPSLSRRRHVFCVLCDPVRSSRALSKFESLNNTDLSLMHPTPKMFCNCLASLVSHMIQRMLK